MDLALAERAAFQVQRRAIKIEWIEAAILTPDGTETRDGKTSFLKCHTERGKMLRVVTQRSLPCDNGLF